MSIDATVAILYAQTNLAAPLVNTLAVAPQASLSMSKVLAAEMAKQEQQKIAKTEKIEKASIRPDDKGSNSSFGFGSRRRGRPEQMENLENEDKPQISPLIGNLLNVKV